MTPSELEHRSAALYGNDWQSPLARRVRVDARTVRKWKSGDRAIPDWLEQMLLLLEKYPSER